MNGSSIAGRAPPGVPRCERFLHVLAGAEAASGAGEDRDFEAVVVAEFGPGLGQRGAHLGVQRVQPLRAVHAHDQDLPVYLGLDDGHVISHRRVEKTEFGAVAPARASPKRRGVFAR